VNPKRRRQRSIFAFVMFVAALAGQRLLEMKHSQRNEAFIESQGGKEHASGHFALMKALHTSWFVAMLVEVTWLKRPFRPLLAAVAFLLLVTGQLLRYAAIRALGPRWSVRVMTLPGANPVTHGIYRYVRHPNYLGVVLEIAAVPLLHGAHLTSLTFSLANALLLALRISIEERALAGHNQYLTTFADRPRFIPKLPWRR
jgi:methyltransferase